MNTEILGAVKKDGETLFAIVDGDYLSKDPDPLLGHTWTSWHWQGDVVCFQDLEAGTTEIFDETGLSELEYAMDAAIAASENDTETEGQ